MRSASCQGHNNSTMEESQESRDKIMVTLEKISYQPVNVLKIGPFLQMGSCQSATCEVIPTIQTDPKKTINIRANHFYHRYRETSVTQARRKFKMISESEKISFRTWLCKWQ